MTLVGQSLQNRMARAMSAFHLKATAERTFGVSSGLAQRKPVRTGSGAYTRGTLIGGWLWSTDELNEGAAHGLYAHQHIGEKMLR
jgi:hypothetical protein